MERFVACVGLLRFFVVVGFPTTFVVPLLCFALLCFPSRWFAFFGVASWYVRSVRLSFFAEVFLDRWLVGSSQQQSGCFFPSW